MVDQTTRLEIATVNAEIGSNIVYRFANDAAAAAEIPTDSGDIPNLKQVIVSIQEEGAEKISFATTIYPTTAAGIAATTNGAIFLVQSVSADEIYTVWQNVSGVATDTGKRALNSQAVKDAETAAQASAASATASASAASTAAANAAASFTTIFQADQAQRSADFAASQAAMGYEIPVPYATGILIQRVTQLIEHDGELYKAKPGTLPWTTTGTWSADSAQLVSVGDAALRSQLAGTTGAEMVFFSQKGSGSIARMLSAKLGESVSIADKGAVGDGVTDSASALLSAGLATTGSILVPDGNYVVTATTANSAGIAALLGRLKVHGTLQINLASGAHNFTQPFTVFSGGLGVNAIKIVGAAPVPLSITGQFSVSGSAGAYSVTLSVSTVTGVAVGDYLHTVTVAGTGVPEVHRGLWEITAVDAINSRITLKNTCRKATFPTNTIASSTSTALKTVLKFASCDGIVVTGGRLDFLDNVAIVGNSDSYWSSANVGGTEKGTHGMIVGSQTIALNGKADSVNPYGVSLGHVSCGPNVGVNGFDQQGILTELGGTFWGDFVSSCNNKRRGFYASTASGIRAKHISSNGNYLDGVICDIGGSIYSSSTSCAVGNGARGVSASQSGALIFDSGIMSHNGSDGGAALLGGTLQATGARYEFNGGSGAFADYGSTAIVNNSNMLGNTSYGIDAGFNAAVRALSSVINSNLLHGIRSTELAVVVITGTTFSGNVVGDKTTRGEGMILDGSTYTLADRSGLSFKSIQGAAGQGIRLTSTSGGDDCQIQHDTTGAGTYTTTFHARSGTGGLYPEANNSVILGRASNLWSVVYAGTGTINTSDARMKTEVSLLTPEELAASAALAKEIGTFRWLDSVAVKGDAARNHIGMTVQKAMSIMESFGLDPMSYGFICYDSWESEPDEVVIDEDGKQVAISKGREAGDRYAFRMDQLSLFIAAGQEQRLAKLEALLA